MHAVPGHKQHAAIGIASAPDARRDFLVTGLREQGHRPRRPGNVTCPTP